VITYGKAERLVAAVSFDQSKWLEFYQRLIERAAAFPVDLPVVDRPPSKAPVPAAFPDGRLPNHDATVVLTGYDPMEQRVEWIPNRPAAPRTGTRATA
jgi:hypothetical protein